jgi:hypothetical protein
MIKAPKNGFLTFVRCFSLAMRALSVTWGKRVDRASLSANGCSGCGMQKKRAAAGSARPPSQTAHLDHADKLGKDGLPRKAHDQQLRDLLGHHRGA